MTYSREFIPCFLSLSPSMYPQEMATLFDIPLKTIAGESTTLAPFKGHVLLIVNTASKCGLTPQYEGLEKLYSTYKHCGFDILGFPANDFAGQEPGSNQEIQKFCTTTFNISFPMFEKVVATGPEKSPLYDVLTTAQPVARVADPEFKNNLRGYGLTVNDAPELTWNFEKFLVNRKGQVVARFAPDTLPTDPALIQAIERELPPLEGASNPHGA
jgi:glutathione peroxidase